MKYWYAKPNKSIAEFIRTVLVMEGFSKGDSRSLPIVTNGMPALFCKTERAKDRIENISNLLLFNHSSEEIWKINSGTTIIAYFFKPFALPAVFNISASQINKNPFDLAIWNPHRSNALKTQLIYAGSTAKKIETLDYLLIQQAGENEEVYKIIKYATDQIMANSNREIISEVITTLQLNERTFQRIFKKYVGITATQYRRICQFEQSIGQLRGKKFEKITDVAFDNGYADQSHFIRTFKEFTQITPADYLKKGLKSKRR